MLFAVYLKTEICFAIPSVQHGLYSETLKQACLVLMLQTIHIISSAMEVMFLPLLVCLLA